MSDETFSLEGREHVALQHLLKLEGWCESGATAKHRIDAGDVCVDGQVERRKRCKIVAGQTVTMDDFTIKVVA